MSDSIEKYNHLISGISSSLIFNKEQRLSDQFYESLFNVNKSIMQELTKLQFKYISIENYPKTIKQNNEDDPFQIESFYSNLMSKHPQKMKEFLFISEALYKTENNNINGSDAKKNKSNQAYKLMPGYLNKLKEREDMKVMIHSIQVYQETLYSHCLQLKKMRLVDNLLQFFRVGLQVMEQEITKFSNFCEYPDNLIKSAQQWCSTTTTEGEEAKEGKKQKQNKCHIKKFISDSFQTILNQVSEEFNQEKMDYISSKQSSSDPKKTKRISKRKSNKKFLNKDQSNEKQQQTQQNPQILSKCIQDNFEMSSNQIVDQLQEPLTCENQLENLEDQYCVAQISSVNGHSCNTSNLIEEEESQQTEQQNIEQNSQIPFDDIQDNDEMLSEENQSQDASTCDANDISSNNQDKTSDEVIINFTPEHYQLEEEKAKQEVTMQYPQNNSNYQQRNDCLQEEQREFQCSREQYHYYHSHPSHPQNEHLFQTNNQISIDTNQNFYNQQNQQQSEENKTILEGYMNYPQNNSYYQQRSDYLYQEQTGISFFSQHNQQNSYQQYQHINQADNQISSFQQYSNQQNQQQSEEYKPILEDSIESSDYHSNQYLQSGQTQFSKLDEQQITYDQDQQLLIS